MEASFIAVILAATGRLDGENQSWRGLNIPRFGTRLRCPDTVRRGLRWGQCRQQYRHGGGPIHAGRATSAPTVCGPSRSVSILDALYCNPTCDGFPFYQSQSERPHEGRFNQAPPAIREDSSSNVLVPLKQDDATMRDAGPPYTLRVEATSSTNMGVWNVRAFEDNGVDMLRNCSKLNPKLLLAQQQASNCVADGRAYNSNGPLAGHQPCSRTLLPTGRTRQTRYTRYTTAA